MTCWHKGCFESCLKVLPGLALLLLLATGFTTPNAMAAAAPASPAPAPTLALAPVILLDLPTTISVSGIDDSAAATTRLRVGGEALLPDATGTLSYTPTVSGWQQFSLEVNGVEVVSEQRFVLPGWLTILPPIVAFLLAILLREVIPALFVALWLGTVLILGPSFDNIVPGLMQAASTYGVAAVVDEGHAMLIVFTLMVGGLVAVLSRSGGTQGIVNQVIGWANSPRRGQSATAAMGLAIFFDDYANTLVVGKTMRPVTDALRISREKLAYLVDSTAAPVATMAIVSSWIGFQVGLIDDAISSIPEFTISAYAVFINSLAYNYYPILTLLLVTLVAVTGRDFGPMRRAEERAAATGALFSANARIGDSTELAALDPKPGTTPRAINAYLPLAILVGGVLLSLYITGSRNVAIAEPSIMQIIGASDSYLSMIWATLASLVVAIGLTVGQRILSLGEAMEAWLVGAKTMLLALVVLVLAWALASVNEALQTADWLSAQLSDQLDARLLPPIVFLLAALTAFATGTSWGVMGILMPLVIPLVWAAAGQQAHPDPTMLVYAATSAVLAGAVMGDHCSPVADTSILSASATSCDLIDHIKTQLPYALITGAVAVAVGLLPAMYGLPWWVTLALASVTLISLFYWLTRNHPPIGLSESDDSADSAQTSAAPSTSAA